MTEPALKQSADPRGTSRSTSPDSSRSRVVRSRRRHTSRDKTSGSHTRRRQLRRAAIAASIGVLVCSTVILALVLAVVVHSARDYRQRNESEVAELRTKSRDDDTKLKRLQSDMVALTNQRLPFPLQPLRFDEVFPLAEEGVVSVLFTDVGTAGAPAYDYRVVMRNKTESEIFPEVYILLFNGAGIQVGGADVRDSSAWKHSGSTGLGPGEVMTVSGRIVLNFDAPLSYFAVVRKSPDGSLPKLPF